MLKNGEVMEIGFVLENGGTVKNTNSLFFGVKDLFGVLPSMIESSMYRGWKKWYVNDICWFDKTTGVLWMNNQYINFSNIIDILKTTHGTLKEKLIKYGDDMYVLDKGELCKCDKTPKAKQTDKPTDIVVSPEVVKTQPTTITPKADDIIVDAEIVETAQSQQSEKEKPVVNGQQPQKPKEELKPTVKEQSPKDNVPKPKENKKPEVVNTVSSERMFEFTTQWDKTKPVKKAGKVNIGFVSEKSDLRSHVLPMLSQVHCVKFTGENPRFTMTNIILQTIDIMRKSDDMTMYGNTLKGANFNVMETEVGKYVINTDLAVIGTNRRLVIHVDVVAKTVFAQVV